MRSKQVRKVKNIFKKWKKILLLLLLRQIICLDTLPLFLNAKTLLFFWNALFIWHSLLLLFCLLPFFNTWKTRLNFVLIPLLQVRTKRIFMCQLLKSFRTKVFFLCQRLMRFGQKRFFVSHRHRTSIALWNNVCSHDIQLCTCRCVQ